MKANCVLEDVTSIPDLWKDSDPVRPELSVMFKVSEGRKVFGLKGEDGTWKAFMCYARTFLIPKDVNELGILTDRNGNVIVPYTVWSNEKGAGRMIIKEVLSMVKDKNMGVDRVVTLSPKTEMARKFHLRNGAKEFRMNSTTVNFEYDI